MYARYIRNKNISGEIHYQFKEYISLFGCNKGFIPWLMSLNIPLAKSEPYLWHVDIINELSKTDNYKSNTLLIDLKPKQIEKNLSLYEILDVWGYSDSGWTPILLRLQGLFVDAIPSSVDSKDFLKKETEIDKPIYEFMYLAGTVKDGKKMGLWTAPPASPTNAALLWPNTLKYFLQCIKDTSPELFSAG